jgi:hypothetical protein
MRLRMLTTARGAEDGHTVREYLAGREYDIGGTPRADELARAFVRERWAEDAQTAKPPEQVAPSVANAHAVERLAKKKGR